MKIVKTHVRDSVMRPVGEMAAGTVIINGEGNICMVCRPEARCGGNGEKVRMVNLAIGGVYNVLPTCRYEEVDATLTWQYKGVSNANA